MTTTVIVKANHGWPVSVMQVDPKTVATIGMPVTVEPNTEQTFCVHSGADLHIHEIQPAASPSNEAAAQHQGLPVAGYRPQDEGAISLVNINKKFEEGVLRILDSLANNPDIDKRWLSIGRTQIEQGFMAVNRAIFKPGRISLNAQD